MSNKDIRNGFIKEVADFSKKNNLFEKSGKYLVALSGGADSVALLMVLKELGIDVDAVTCNFHLRGEESNRDEQFCISLCSKIGVVLHRCHFDTLSYSKVKKISVEMAARDLRYNYFERLRQDLGARAICVAHHKDDCVETVLINLIRGTGVNGLKGIVPVNGNIIRPLLCVGRDDIERFLGSINQDYVTDSSNLVDNVLRNKIRLNLLPLLENINPNVRNNIYNTSLNVVESLNVFNVAIADAAKMVMTAPNIIDVTALMQQASPEYTLFYILKSYGFSPAAIKRIFGNLDAESGRKWSSNDYELLLDRNKLVIMAKKEKLSAKTMKVSETGTYVYKEGMKFSFSIEQRSSSYVIDTSAMCACLDADKIAFPLSIRNVKTGDRFHPIGMSGSKLVSDYLTDRKKNCFEKEMQLVVTDSVGQIMWLVGERPDQRFKITESTISVLKIVLHA